MKEELIKQMPKIDQILYRLEANNINQREYFPTNMLNIFTQFAIFGILLGIITKYKLAIHVGNIMFLLIIIMFSVNICSNFLDIKDFKKLDDKYESKFKFDEGKK